MFTVPDVIVSIFLIVLSYLVYEYNAKFRKVRRVLSWIPQCRRWPIVGSLLEFRGSAETLEDLDRIMNNPSKMSYVEGTTVWDIMCRNYEFTEFILSSTSILDKGIDYKFFHDWLGTGLLTSTGTKWKKRRRVITPAFHFSILVQFIETFESNSNVLITKLDKAIANNDVVDIYEYVTLCTLDTICESAMGVKINSQQEQSLDYVFAVKDFCRILMVRAFSPWKRVQSLFVLTEDYKAQRHHLEVLHGFSNSVIEKRRQEFANEKLFGSLEVDSLGRKRKLAFLDLLLNSTIDGKPLSQEDIREEVDTFIFEGHDTTASGISSALFLLANHPEAQQLVRGELKQIYGKERDRPTTQQDLQDMKYLELVIKEALRLYPPVPIISRRMTQDIEYKGHIVPKDTVVDIYIYGMNRDPEFYESPNSFKPERFLDINSKFPYSYIPFSAGPRNCIGQKFAMLEMKCMISKIIKNFELLLTDPPHQLVMVTEVVLKSMNGVKVRLQKVDWN